VADGPETETETEADAEPEAVFQALESVESARSPPAALSVSVAPLALEWQGIGCSYNTPTGLRQVLADVWGSAQPGEMQALLGPSGWVRGPGESGRFTGGRVRAAHGSWSIAGLVARLQSGLLACGSPNPTRPAAATRLPALQRRRKVRRRPPQPTPPVPAAHNSAGKSTFMDILALRKSVGNLTGRLLVNGVRATRRFVRKTSYVPQDDNFVPTMTTWEVMSFYADVSQGLPLSASSWLVKLAVGLRHTPCLGSFLHSGCQLECQKAFGIGSQTTQVGM
jgi:hypothetical protein